MATTWKTAAKVVRLLFLSCNGMRNMVLLKLKEITMTLNPEAPMQKKILPVILAIALILSSTFSILCFHNLQGNAKVINYAGIVRGATQRLVKEELNGIPNDLLIEKLDVYKRQIQNHPQSVNILLALYGRLVLRLLKICKQKIHQGMEHRIFL